MGRIYKILSRAEWTLAQAAGVFDDQGQLVAGLSISAPSDRLEESWMERVKATAAQISAALGYRGPSTPATA